MSISLLHSAVIFPNGSNVSYKKHIEISNLTQYLISISNYSTERINSKPPEDFDFIMSWLGNALYPMTVRMDSSGEATGIENIDEVKERYAAEGQKIIDYYEQDALVTKYVKGCVEKVQDEKEVLQCISQTNIYQLATLYMAITTREYRLVDFPLCRRCYMFLSVNRR